MNNGYQPKKIGDKTPPAPPTSGSNIQEAVFRAFEIIIRRDGKRNRSRRRKVGEKGFLEEYEMKVDPYEEVEKILRDWCDKNYYTPLIVRLKLDGEIENVVVEWDEDLTCCFNWDFYEGQENIELIGFIPVHDVPTKNECNIMILGGKEK